MRRPPPVLTRATALLLTAGLAGAVPMTAAHADPATSRQRSFSAAAEQYGVPESVLLGVSYLESRWDAHPGTPSTAGGFGPMNLTDTAYVSARALAAQHGDAQEGDARGDTARPVGGPASAGSTTGPSSARHGAA
ncbi:MAG: hypothetical protein WCA46_15075, partial [Actinocatenispora sp.]